MPFVRVLSMALLLLLGGALFAQEHDMEKARSAFEKGDYKKAAKLADAAIKNHERGEEWRIIHARALWMTGEYAAAKESIALSQRLYYFSIRIRLLAYKIFRANGDLESARSTLEEINSLGGSRRWSYRDAQDILALGEAAVLLGADPKFVLDTFFSPVKKADPNLKETYLAIGNLALDKHDYALAGKAFQEGLQKNSKDPDLLFGMAQALAPSDREEMLKLLEQVFEANPNHPGARLLLAEHLIDAEEYEEAGRELDKVQEVNALRPEMWAYRAVIAHLKSDFAREAEFRSKGLKTWAANPEVDHLIGRKLSQKYRFREGSAHQRQALEFEPVYLPAQAQLAEDLLRLGEEEEGWKLAEAVSLKDPYDVTAFNLVTLHDTMKSFVSLTNDHFTLKMSPHEAEVYGGQVLELLEQARKELTRKYKAELSKPTTVEIFPQQKDFAVRTFGIPGQEGYLGVCFGDVITANSPASHTMNWHSVLWHEFCHVITLNLTKNKMPRWLSEGISVYEERRGNPRWGEQIIPQYRDMILEGKMKPINDMSAAFMAPPSGLHLQFAYYQSSLVVEFIMERFGADAIRGILQDLGEGKEINASIEARTTKMAVLQKDFEDFAKGVAESMGTKLAWDKPKRDENGDIEKTWALAHPGNFWVLKEQADELMRQGKMDEAVPVLLKSLELYPGQGGENGPYAVLANIYAKQGDKEKEREILKKWVMNDDQAGPALKRLLELETGDSQALKSYSNMLLQVNPLTPIPYRALATAQEKSGNVNEAISNYRTLLKLEPADLSEVHYNLARLLKLEDPMAAKRHVLLALEEAPRYRAAHKLLLELSRE